MTVPTARPLGRAASSFSYLLILERRMRFIVKIALWILAGLFCFTYFGFPGAPNGVFDAGDQYSLLAASALWGIFCILINRMFRTLPTKPSAVDSEIILDPIRTKLVGTIQCSCGTVSQIAADHAENTQCPRCCEFFRITLDPVLTPLGEEHPTGAVAFAREANWEREAIVADFERSARKNL